MKVELISDIVLGYESLREYKNSNTYFGAAIGPISDRIANGHCEIDNKSIQFPVNAGPDCMHSGSNAFHSRVWDWEILRNGIAFSYCFSAKESPLPGHLQVSIRYFLKPANTLRIEYETICDKNTCFSMTNHSYFTLNGGVSHCRDQILTVHADCYAQTEREAEPVCTGRVLPVEDTPFDLRRGKRIGDVLENPVFPEIRTAGGLDHYFPVKGEGMREHARLCSKEDGLALLCISDMPGLLIYTANGLETERGKNGCIYEKNYAICMETECFPSAVNSPLHRYQVFQPAKKTISFLYGISGACDVKNRQVIKRGASDWPYLMCCLSTGRCLKQGWNCSRHYNEIMKCRLKRVLSLDSTRFSLQTRFSHLREPGLLHAARTPQGVLVYQVFPSLTVIESGRMCASTR